MYLELSIASGEGYISTFSDDAISLNCKPTATHVIEDLLDDYQKNRKFRVESFGSSNGDQRHIIKEKFQRDFKPETKNDVEYNRYKQDCRKRALDLGYQQVNVNRTNLNIEATDVLAAAEVYYAWLTANL